jgi:hypothetical protein
MGDDRASTLPKMNGRVSVRAQANPLIALVHSSLFAENNIFSAMSSNFRRSWYIRALTPRMWTLYYAQHLTPVHPQPFAPVTSTAEVRSCPHACPLGTAVYVGPPRVDGSAQVMAVTGARPTRIAPLRCRDVILVTLDLRRMRKEEGV